MRHLWAVADRMPIVRRPPAVAFLAASLALLATSGDALAAVTTVEPRGRRSAPARNYGAHPRLHASGAPARRAYLRFGVPRLGGRVRKATLRLLARTGSSSGPSLRPVAVTSWRERAMTWSNAPAVGAVAGSTGPITNRRWRRSM
jgi:hypothetical protein